MVHSTMHPTYIKSRNIWFIIMTIKTYPNIHYLYHVTYRFHNFLSSTSSGTRSGTSASVRYKGIFKLTRVKNNYQHSSDIKAIGFLQNTPLVWVEKASKMDWKFVLPQHSHGTITSFQGYFFTWPHKNRAESGNQSSLTVQKQN